MRGEANGVGRGGMAYLSFASPDRRYAGKIEGKIEGKIARLCACQGDWKDD